MAGRRNSALLDAFRKQDFDVASFVRDATAQGGERVTKLTQQLEDCAGNFDAELQREIVACHDELLQNASNINSLDGQLGDIRDVAATLKSSVQRVKGDIIVPFQNVRRRTKLLGRMESVNALIRNLRRFLTDARKLRNQMDSPARDLSKAANTLQELEDALKEEGLERVQVLRAEVAWIRETSARIRHQAQNDLRVGAKTGNQVALTGSFQVFFNLQCLWPQLKGLLSEMLDEFVQVALPAGASFHAAFGMNLEVLGVQIQKVQCLEEVLRTKIDPATQRPFASVMGGTAATSLISQYWTDATESLKAKFLRVMQERGFRRTLVAECPKILRAMADVVNKVNNASASRAKEYALAGPERDALLATVADIRSEFLGESIRRVTEPVEMMLPEKLLAASGSEQAGHTVGDTSTANSSDDLPTSHDLKRYVQLLVAEMERCEVCEDLVLKDIVKTARSSVLLFATRLERVVDMSCVEIRCFENEAGLQLKKSLPMPASGHARNARLFGIAHHTLCALKDTVPMRFQSAIATQQVETTLRQTQAAIVSPMFNMLRQAMTSSVASAAVMQERSADGSLRILNVSLLCGHISKYYLPLFGSGPLASQVKELCAHFVRTFLSAVALFQCHQGDGEDARNNLAQDMQNVEVALCALDVDFQSNIRFESAVFKEFRKLVCASGMDSLDFDALSNVIPLPLLLTFLIQRLPGNAPSIPQLYGAEGSDIIETVLVPSWDEPPDGPRMQTLRSKIGELSDKYDLDPSSSTAVAFIMSQMG